MEITERLRNTPTGLIVLVGDMKIIVEKYKRTEQDPVQGMRLSGRGSEILRILICLHGPSEAGSRERSFC